MNPATEIALLRQEIVHLKEKQEADERDIIALKKDSADVHKMMNRGAGAFVALAGLGMIIGWFLATGKDVLTLWRAK